MASESPERLEELRERFLVALYDLSGGMGVGTALISEVGRRAGLDPERDPEERALCERLASELVEAGYATAEVGSSGTLGIMRGERFRTSAAFGCSIFVSSSSALLKPCYLFLRAAWRKGILRSSIIAQLDNGCSNVCGTVVL